MAILQQLGQLDLSSWLLLVPSTVLVGHVVLWLADPYKIRGYPGPLFAKFSDVWLGYVAAQGHRSEVVHDLHKKHGEHPMSMSAVATPSLVGGFVVEGSVMATSPFTGPPTVPQTLNAVRCPVPTRAPRIRTMFYLSAHRIM